MLLRSVVSGVSLAFLTACQAKGSAAPDHVNRFTPSPVQSDALATSFTPLGAVERKVTVVLEIAGEPVARVQAARAMKLGSAERVQIAQALEARQDAVAAHVVAHGGEVLARMQHAINGVKVRVSRSELASLASAPGVVAVRPVRTYRPVANARPENAISVPFIGAPIAWDTGFHGEGVKVAIVDTGIDYTHADFGGPGTADAFAAAQATSTLPPDPALVGPSAPKVKAGTDLVGDAYDAGSADPAKNTPAPDPNPLDCNGHGSHVSGTAVGFGVTADGHTYTGPYTSAAEAATPFLIGPGVAPRADLYFARVFGCTGSTNVVAEAIDWAVQQGVDVISLSLGADFGTAEDADAVAAENAARAGIQVVAAAGNAGAGEYITSSPAAGNRVVSVAAIDSTPSFPAASVALSPAGQAIVAQNSNHEALPAGGIPVVVLKNPDGTMSLGCSEAEYADAAISGKLVVTLRGVCARVDRATFAARHGAAAVAMINDAAGFPPFEGAIPNVAIPFLGIQGAPSTDGDALAAAASATLAPTTLVNPGFEGTARFSSGGPRLLDSALEPSIAAPGVSVFSAAVGTGDQGLFESGTSMATPHVAGVAALVKQAHPTWTIEERTAALLGTGDPSKVKQFAPRLAGSGVVSPGAATATQAVAIAQEAGALNLSLGFAEIVEHDFTALDFVTLVNEGAAAATFEAAAAAAGGSSPHSVEVSPSSVSLAPGQSARVRVSVTVPAATAGNSDAFREVAGLVTFTPATGSNGGVALRVPYYLVPRARSKMDAKLDRPFGTRTTTVNATVRNEDGAIDGTADFYAWGPSTHPDGTGSINVRAAGVQAFTSAGNRFLVFAINNYGRFNSAATNEYDVLLDVDGDGVPDWDVFSFDLGALTAGAFDGTVATFVQNLKTGATSVRFLADARTDGSTILLPVLTAQLVDRARPAISVTPTHPRFTYSTATLNLLNGDQSASDDKGSFNAFAPAVETGQFATVRVGGTATVPVHVDAAEFAKTPATGLMIVNVDDPAGAEQADLLRASGK